MTLTFSDRFVEFGWIRTRIPIKEKKILMHENEKKKIVIKFLPLGRQYVAKIWACPWQNIALIAPPFL